MANVNEVYCGNCATIMGSSNRSYAAVMLLPSPMRCIKTGAAQLDPEGNDMMQNMDIFECPLCKNRMIKR